MAKGESQGLQIAVIIFAFLTIILSVATFYFFNEWSKADQRAAALEADNQTKTQEYQYIRNVALRRVAEMVGFTFDDRNPDAKPMLDQWEQHYQRDKAAYMDERLVPQNKGTYSDVLPIYIQEVAKYKAQAEQERQNLTAWKQEIDNRLQQLQANIQQASNQFNQRVQDFLNEKDRLVEREQGLQQQVADAQRRAAEKATEVNQIQAQLAQVQQEHQKQIQKLEGEVRSVATTLQELRTETFEVPDGEIRYVSPSGGTVWINLGAADNLRPQVTFSVFAQGVQGLGHGQRKGSIEVIKILGDHLAEARLTESNPRDPVLKGDVIYTPLWHRGRSERFAIAGFMDVNGDGIDDREIIKEIIRLAGGVIDAELLNDGSVQGQMSVETRYLVVGDPPPKYLEVYSDLRRQADTMGVSVMPLAKFLDHTGFTGLVSVKTFGRHSRFEDFLDAPTVDKRQVGASHGNVSGSFIPRRPPQGNNGAY
jgi:hypothetical protein